MNINQLVRESYATASEKGWWDEERPFAENIALMHSELSEALEDFRDRRGMNQIYYEEDKPCGISIEFADTIIRIADVCGYYGIDLEAALKMKMEYNKTRPYKHGKAI